MCSVLLTPLSYGQARDAPEPKKALKQILQTKEMKQHSGHRLDITSRCRQVEWNHFLGSSRQHRMQEDALRRNAAAKKETTNKPKGIKF